MAGSASTACARRALDSNEGTGEQPQKHPRAGRVVLYCDCPQATLIQDAFQVLKDDHGYRNIAIMSKGIKGWL